MKMSKKGFTLIELLVVIAIIAILAAILFPVFAKAREKARQTTCTSSMKQLGLAIIQYEQDYDEFLPYEVNGNNGAGWAHEIYPYIKATAVYTCPDDLTAPSGSNIPISYIMNRCALDAPTLIGQGVYGIGGAIPKLNAPAATVCLYEGANIIADPTSSAETASQAAIGAGGSNLSTDTYWPDYTGQEGYTNFVWVDTGQFNNRFMPIAITTTGGTGGGLDPAFSTGRHTNASNYEMFDGHVKWLNATSVSSGPNPRNGSTSCTQDAAGCTESIHGANTNAASTASLPGSQYSVTFSTY